MPFLAAGGSSGLERAVLDECERSGVVAKSVGMFRRAFWGCEA